MEFLLDNPIARIPGPEFIRLYWLVCLMALVAAWWATRFGGQRDEARPPAVDNDPYAAAFLRGGATEVSRLAIAELLQKGHLVVEGRDLQPLPGSKQKVSGIAERARAWFLGQRQPLEKVLQRSNLPGELEPVTEAIRRQLEASGLLADERTQAFRRKAVGFILLAVLGLGGLKLLIALLLGKSNILFLIVTMIAMLIALAIVLATAPRFTRKGRRHLKDLQFAFDGFKSQLGTNPQMQLDPRFLLAVGLFGVPILAGTAYAAYADELERARVPTSGSTCSSSSCSSTTSSSSSCSSGDSGSSCGGGGGCGGCGGGGGD